MKAWTKDDIMDLSMQQFLELVNQDRPKITGGCVLLINAALSVSMILMTLRISRKKTSEQAAKLRIMRGINVLSNIQTWLLTAAADDLKSFSEYLRISRSNSKNSEANLVNALRRATMSLLNAAKRLQQTISEVKTLQVDVDSVVACDLDAGLLMLEASYNGLIRLTESNISSLPPDEQLGLEITRT